VRAALEAATAAADPAAAAGCVARALAWLLEAARTRGREWDAALRGAQRAAVEALLEPRLATVVHAVVDGTAPEAWRVVQLAAGRAVPLLINRLGDAATIEERRRCVNALLDAGDGGDALLEGLRDPRWYVVRNVALILGELREPAAVRALARCLQHEDERVREAAAQALTRIDTPAATHALLSGLRAPDASVRRLAARAASRAAEHRVPLAPEVLAARVRIEPDRDVALELVDAVQGIGTPEAWGVLAGLAVHQESAHHDGAVRGAALRALRRVPPTRLMAALRAHAQGDDVRLRRAAVQAAQLLLARAG
jgi:HEAT repeat protein